MNEQYILFGLYYKYADNKVIMLFKTELNDFIDEWYNSYTIYEKYFDIHEFETKILLFLKHGQQNLKDQQGWGYTTCIKLINGTITQYNHYDYDNEFGNYDNEFGDYDL